MDDSADGVDLAEAITALRDALARTIWDGRGSRVRFRVEPVELTVQAGVTRSGSGTAGLRWHILTLSGERSHQAATMQTLRLRLAPVFFDEAGREMPSAEQLVTDHADGEPRTAMDRPTPEPA